MLAFPRFGRGSIFDIQSRKKRLQRRTYVLAAAVVAFLALCTLFFTVRTDYALVQKDIMETPVPTPTPLPTEINANFFAQVNECFIPVAAVYGYTLRITEGFRSATAQSEIYEQGRMVDGHIVTWAPVGRSIHNYGYAVDVVDRWRGYDINWKRLAKIGEYCKLAQVDDPHFEYRGGLSTEDFMAGKTPPPLALPCAVMGERTKAGAPLTRKDLQECSTPSF